MNKNTIIVVVVLVLLAGFGWFYNNPKEETLKEQENTEVENTLTVASDQKALSVSSTESKATYEIDEELQGKPVRVVGNNQGLEGSIIIDTKTQNIIKATILLNANSFVTDIAKRDENVKALVLKSNQELNKYITFTMTRIEGLPTDLEKGVEYDAKIIGDLFISGTTKEVTFDSKIKYEEDGAMSVKAKSKLAYEEFGIAVPDLPFLSNVSKNVDLAVSLIAR